MPDPNFIKLITDNPLINRIQDRSRDSGSRSSTIGQGILLEGIEISATPKEVEHKLGRRFQGAICVKSNSPVTIAVTDSATDSSRFVSITASGAATASFWVF